MTEPTLVKIRMSETRTGAPDGVQVVQLREGEDYVVPTDFARSAIEKGRAQIAADQKLEPEPLEKPDSDESGVVNPDEAGKADAGPAENKDAGPAPANKRGGRRRKSD